MYRYISRESCSQFDSLPLTSLTIPLCPRSRALRSSRSPAPHRGTWGVGISARRWGYLLGLGPGAIDDATEVDAREPTAWISQCIARAGVAVRTGGRGARCVVRSDVAIVLREPRAGERRGGAAAPASKLLDCVLARGAVEYVQVNPRVPIGGGMRRSVPTRNLVALGSEKRGRSFAPRSHREFGVGKDGYVWDATASLGKSALTRAERAAKRARANPVP
jgi:hypothetical protein